MPCVDYSSGRFNPKNLEGLNIVTHSVYVYLNEVLENVAYIAGALLELYCCFLKLMVDSKKPI
jgi:hypothetical protein